MRRTIAGVALAAVAFALAAVTGQTETILVSNEKGNSLTVLDCASLAVVKTVPVGQRPRGIVLSKDGKQL